jgi:hypothetical protein
VTAGAILRSGHASRRAYRVIDLPDLSAPSFIVQTEPFMNKTLLAFAILGLSTAAQAGADASCHFHGSKPAAQATVVQCAVQYKDKLVEGGKLEKSWQTVSQTASIEQVDGKRSKEWKLSFKNPSATDKSKDTLYLFYTLPGNFVAANHTGQ